MDTDGRVAFLVRGLRTRTLLRCANDANDLRLVWVTAREVRRRHQHLLGSGVWKSVLGSTTFTEADLDDAAVREVAGVTGLSLHRAGVWIGTADRLCGSMPRVVQALAAGTVGPGPGDHGRGRVHRADRGPGTGGGSGGAGRAAARGLGGHGPGRSVGRDGTAGVHRDGQEGRGRGPHRHRRRDRERGPRAHRHLARDRPGQPRPGDLDHHRPDRTARRGRGSLRGDRARDDP